MTFSLVARCADTGMFGLAVSSSSPAVAARCAFARAGVGAVATQNITDPALGPLALNLMKSGLTAAEAIGSIKVKFDFIEYRQLLAVDRQGGTAIHSGARTLGLWGEAQAKNVAAGGNLLSNTGVPDAIVDSYLSAQGHLGDRLIAALQAGLDEGGEAGPVHSAGMMIVDQVSWPIAEIRCDWSEDCPIDNISAAWGVYKPQMDAYLKRALDPREAPSYGVPGDV